MSKYAPIDPKYAEAMNRLAADLDNYFNGDLETREVGFFLAVFPFGDTTQFNYISNARREDIICALKELTARFQGQPESNSEEVH